MRTLVALFVLVALGAGADAKFAATQGFSGKHGVSCESCHTPFAADRDPPAVAVLDGLPPAWDYDAPIKLTVRVRGGPTPNPVPGQPQGGFDLETDLGRFGPGEGMQDLLRFPHPMEATYTGAGTLRREWTVTWTPPNVSAFPREARFWLAVVAADGNHIMGGPDLVGERGDKTARIEARLPPSEGALAAWRSQPLPAPVFDAPKAGAAYVTGRVADFAEGALWRLDGGEWRPAAGAPSFVIQLPRLAPGRHVVEAIAVWMERSSEPAVLVLESPGAASAEAAPQTTGQVGAIGALVCLALVACRKGVWR